MSGAAGPRGQRPLVEAASDDELAEIAAVVQSAAVRTTHLWRADGHDGDRTARLIEASHALHRAARALSDQMLRYLERIVANTKRLSALVDAVLDVARLESGEIAYEPVVFDLATLVRGLVEEAGLAQGTRPHRFNATDHLPAALGDPDTYVRVVTNLLSNATRYSNSNGVRESHDLRHFTRRR